MVPSLSIKHHIKTNVTTHDVNLVMIINTSLLSHSCRTLTRKIGSPVAVNPLHTFPSCKVYRMVAHCHRSILIIYVDDLLHEQHKAGQMHCINSADCQDKLECQAYGDDTNDLLSSNAGLQHLTTILQRCLAEDLLNYPPTWSKCQAMCFHPCRQAAIPDLLWDSQPIANATFVRFLGLHL
jgi:hypothetical protein